MSESGEVSNILARQADRAEAEARPANRGAALLTEYGQAQREKLAARAHKGDWREQHVSDLWEAMLDEIRLEFFTVVERALTLIEEGKPLTQETVEQLVADLLQESADPGNYSAMIFDNLRVRLLRLAAPGTEVAGHV